MATSWKIIGAEIQSCPNQLGPDTLLSAELGNSNEGTHYALRKAHGKEQSWLDRLLGKGPASYSFRLDPRDEAGARILSDMGNRGISRVALALTQSSDHVLIFFQGAADGDGLLCRMPQSTETSAVERDANCFSNADALGRTRP